LTGSHFFLYLACSWWNNNVKSKNKNEMGRQKLTLAKVKKIKEMLNSGEYTHLEISKKYDVDRAHISKIYAGMKNPDCKYARWSDVK
jgi:hypothetical protein